MKKLIILFLLLSSVITAQVKTLSEAELLEKIFCTTKAEALKNPTNVYRLRLQDYQNGDYKILQQFVNCQVLSFVAASKVDVIPMGISKLINLQYLDISETTITTVSMFTKKNKNLKVVCTKAGQLDSFEKKALTKRKITLIESPTAFPKVFDTKEAISVPPVITNTTPTNTTSATTNTITTNNANTSSAAIPNGMTKDINGKFISNPDNVAIEEGKNVWYVTQNGVKVMYKKSPQHGLFNINGELIAMFPITLSISATDRFSEGLIPVKSLAVGTPEYEKIGYMDSMGNIAIKPQFEDAKEFKNGKALVKVNGKNTYINRKGEVLITGNFEVRVPFYHPKFAIIKFKGDDKYSVINDKGEVLAKNTLTEKETDFDGEYTAKDALEVGLFKSGIMPKEGPMRWGFKNMKGEWIVKPIYNYVSFYAGGLATVETNKTDKIGNDGFVEKALSSSVVTDWSWGVIDKTGKYFLPLEYAKLSDPWHNHYDDEISISCEHKTKGWMIYDSKGKIIFGPIKEYKNTFISRLEPIKNDYILIEYYFGKPNPKRHFSDYSQTQCDFLNKAGKPVLERHEYICYSVNEYGYFAYRNYNECVPIVFAEATSGTKKIHSGWSHISGKNIFHQEDGKMSRSYKGFDCWDFRDNPKDNLREKSWDTYYKNLVSTGIPQTYNEKGEVTEYKSKAIAEYTSSGIDITDIFNKGAFKGISKINGDIRNGYDVFRYNHFDVSGKRK
jgi:hypothetical protein